MSKKAFLRLKSILGLFLILVIFACGNPLQTFHNELKKYGYIPYATPLQFSGPGTLIGGKPQYMSLIAPPETCFPNELNGKPTQLRELDYTSLPTTRYHLNTQNEMFVKLFTFLGSGSPTIKAGANMHIVHTIALEFKDVHIEYLNTFKLTEFYRSQMNELCKEYLDKIGFIIQAIKVGEMQFEFFNQNGAQIELGLENLKDLIDFNLDLKYEIENHTKLIIKTPKYVGYQLGRLRREDNGVSLYRASSTIAGYYNFKHLALFKDSESRTQGETVQDQRFLVPLIDLEEIPIHPNTNSK